MWSDIFKCFDKNFQLFLQKQKEFLGATKHSPPASQEAHPQNFPTIDDLKFQSTSTTTNNLSRNLSGSSLYNYFPDIITNESKNNNKIHTTESNSPPSDSGFKSTSSNQVDYYKDLVKDLVQ